MRQHYIVLQIEITKPHLNSNLISKHALFQSHESLRRQSVSQRWHTYNWSDLAVNKRCHFCKRQLENPYHLHLYRFGAPAGFNSIWDPAVVGVRSCLSVGRLANEWWKGRAPYRSMAPNPEYKVGNAKVWLCHNLPRFFLHFLSGLNLVVFALWILCNIIGH